MDFVLNDESKVNSHGFILVNAGGNFDRFRQNPAMLHNHNSDELIGAWDNLRAEGSMLKAESKFDTDDDFAKKIEGKVTRGFLKGASPGIIILDVELRPMPDGNAIPFVTKWELLEASVVSVPSNAGALKLYNQKGEILENAEQIRLNIDSILNNKQSVVLASTVRKDWDYKRWMKDDPKGLQRMKTERPVAFEQLQAAYKVKFNGKSKFVNTAAVKRTIDNKADIDSRKDWDYKRWMKNDPKGLQRMKTESSVDFERLRVAYKATFVSIEF